MSYYTDKDKTMTKPNLEQLQKQLDDVQAQITLLKQPKPKTGRVFVSHDVANDLTLYWVTSMGGVNSSSAIYLGYEIKQGRVFYDEQTALDFAKYEQLMQRQREAADASGEGYYHRDFGFFNMKSSRTLNFGSAQAEIEWIGSLTERETELLYRRGF